ncbi:MAG: glycosyl transferase family 1 [Neptuniibacter caesariensis]|uniref:tRNA-queuosine alpha-mannosyltransferase n=1 Tax=Neptuniibacter caesariensis TaxID=207954 RepID=A0A2G6JLF7_NEPCE|nr:MAG: glycosyl transferase family 1 [Neptuniibacter caesariensis]
MRILLLSAYDAQSHVYWRKGLVEHLPDYDWTVLSLPGRYFSWRMRGNSLSWAFGEREVLTRPYDLVIATSMTDLSALRGFIPSLAQTPALVYFHENQFAYPVSGKEFKSVEPCILNLYTALAADQCLFNSKYNRRTFLEGAEVLLKKLPDYVPEQITQHLEARASVLPVPLQNDSYLPHQPEEKSFHIVWNHRWEFDKNPQLLLDAITELMKKTNRFRLHVVGQQFRETPPQFALLEKLLEQYPGCKGAWGYMESRHAYQALLQTADVVLSTADHDYQGIAVLEGAAAGAYPVVPDRLAYRELFPAECHYAESDQASALANKLYELIERKRSQKQTLPQIDVGYLSWAQLTDKYRQVIESTAREGGIKSDCD